MEKLAALLVLGTALLLSAVPAQGTFYGSSHKEASFSAPKTWYFPKIEFSKKVSKYTKPCPVAPGLSALQPGCTHEYNFYYYWGKQTISVCAVSGKRVGLDLSAGRPCAAQQQQVTICRPPVAQLTTAQPSPAQQQVCTCTARKRQRGCAWDCHACQGPPSLLHYMPGRCFGLVASNQTSCQPAQQLQAHCTKSDKLPTRAAGCATCMSKLLTASYCTLHLC